jgi:hypothetical protein
MSSITLVQIAEKPSTVTTEEAISSFADNRQGRPASPLLDLNRMQCAPDPFACATNIAVGLNRDNDDAMS